LCVLDTIVEPQWEGAGDPDPSISPGKGRMLYVTGTG